MKMRNHLREAVETAKIYYIQELIKNGIFRSSDQEVYSLPLSELEEMVNKYCRLSKK